MVDQAYQSQFFCFHAHFRVFVILVCIVHLDSQENGLEDKSDPSGKSVQKASCWTTADTVPWSPMVPDGHLVFAGSHGEQEMSGPPHAAGHCLGISTAAWFCFG